MFADKDERSSNIEPCSPETNGSHGRRPFSDFLEHGSQLGLADLQEPLKKCVTGCNWDVRDISHLSIPNQCMKGKLWLSHTN